MAWEVFINGGILQTRLALVHDSQLVEIAHIPLGAANGFGENAAVPGALHKAFEGQIYLGRVVNVARPLNSAFVDIGEAASGFLPLNTLAQRKRTSLAEGEAVLVQVVKSAYQDKGARLSARIEPSLAAELMSRGARAPCLLHQGSGVICSSLMKLCGGVDAAKITIDHPALYALLCRNCNEALRAGLERAAPGELFAMAGIEDQIEDASIPQSPLPGGGSLIFEPTSALTAIDVNAGSMHSDNLRLRVNLEAAEAIAPQLRLRGIGGQIVIDFLALESPAGKNQLYQALKQGLKNDPAATNIEKISRGGLLAITRERRFEPLLPAAPNYAAKEAYAHIAHKILHDLQRRSQQRTGPGLLVQADAGVVKWLDRQPGLKVFLEKNLGITTTWKARDIADVYDYNIGEIP